MRTSLARSAFLLASTVLIASTLSAQNPLSKETMGLFTMTKTNLVKAAEKMPEENYSFRPTPEVRTFGQLVGHVADAQYLFCGAVKGGEVPRPGVEKSKTSKADLVAALKDAMAYCDEAYSALTDTDAAQNVKFFGRERTKLSVLNFNMGHNFEHYGNMVTYMRMKGLVPPSSEGR
jgi:uncharacterized damage-inducible protein DinB